MSSGAIARDARLRPLRPRDRWAAATWVLLGGAGLLALAILRDYGSTWDERVQAELGRDVVAWFTSGGHDERALSGGSAGNLHLYGGVFEALAELAGQTLPLDPVDARHLVNVFAALAGALGTALLGRRLGGSRAAFFAVALLLTTPAWWGHGFANSKDVPFAAAYPWLLLALLRAGDHLPRPRAGLVAAAGVALGAALAVRPGGLLVVLPLAAGVMGVRLLPVLRATPRPAWPAAVAAAGVRLAALAALGWAGMLALWPYGLRHPLDGPAEAVAVARGFPWTGLVRFDGRWFRSGELPWSYAPTWLVSSLPETWFVVALAGAAGAAVAWRRDGVRPTLTPRWLDPALVAVAGVGPIAGVAATRPVLYDGIRHLLFALPALAALGGWALSAAVARLPRRASRMVLGGCAAATALAVLDAARLHPYQYVYFNRLVAGGLRGGAARLELDYWGATGREAAAWLARNVGAGASGPVTVATTADSSVVSHWLEGDPGARGRFAFDPPGVPDVTVATTRWHANRTPGRVLHVVERMGVPLLYVIAAARDGDPVVLEGGDAAVALYPADGWWARPVIEPGPERAEFALRHVGASGRAEIHLRTPRNGGVPGLEDLRAEVVELAASFLRAPPDDLAPEPVVGPAARGWLVVGSDAGGGPVSLVAGGRVDGAAFLLVARLAMERPAAAAEVRRWLERARPAVPEERRPP